MNFPFYIARRYLRSKKSHNVINIISGISVTGVALATAAMVCILSVFNGFQDMVANLFTSFDPPLKVVPAEGKFVAADEPELERLRKDPRVAVYVETIEDNALAVVNNRQYMVRVKGVDDRFTDLVNVESILYGEGAWQLHLDVLDFGVAGVNVLENLGVGVDFPPIQIYSPRQGERIDLNVPLESFNHEELYSPGVAFQVKQGKYDSRYVVTSIGFARRLFERQGYVSAVELRLAPGLNEKSVQRDLQEQLGERFRVLNRYEQQEDSFRIMEIEKLISYIFLCFILLIACFNIIGSLSLLIIDKRDDAQALRNLGADDSQIASIFMTEGRLISLLGAVVGLAVGLGLCLLQEQYGLVRFGREAGTYLVDAYPVSVHGLDLVVIFLTVVAVGFASVWWPVRRLTRKYTRQP